MTARCGPIPNGQFRYHFGTILNPFGPKAAQVLKTGSFGKIVKLCGPKAAQMLQNGKFCCQFEPLAFGQLSLATAFISEWVSFRNNFPLEMAFHSEWLRNNPNIA